MNTATATPEAKTYCLTAKSMPGGLYDCMVLEAVLAKFEDQATDDALRDDMQTDAENAQSLRAKARWARVVRRKAQSDKSWELTIPREHVREISLMASYLADDYADEVTGLGGMSSDDCARYDSEDLANRLYSLHDLLKRLKRFEWELDREIEEAS